MTHSNPTLSIDKPPCPTSTPQTDAKIVFVDLAVRFFSNGSCFHVGKFNFTKRLILFRPQYFLNEVALHKVPLPPPMCL